MAKALRQVVIDEKRALSPNMQRVVLTGESLADFPEGYGADTSSSCYLMVQKTPVRSYHPRVRSRATAVSDRHGGSWRYRARCILGKSFGPGEQTRSGPVPRSQSMWKPTGFCLREI